MNKFLVAVGHRGSDNRGSTVHVHVISSYRVKGKVKGSYLLTLTLHWAAGLDGRRGMGN